MKKLFALVCLMAVTMIAKAGTDINLLGGSYEFMRDADAKMLFEVDYSNTKVGDGTLQQYLKRRGADFVRDWPSDSKRAREYYVARFNKKNKKGVQICESKDSKPKYKMVMHVKTMDMGNGGSTFAPMASSKAGGVIANVVIDVAEYPSGKAVAKIAIPEIKGNGHMSETVRIGMCYFEIATLLAKVGRKNNDVLPIKNSDVSMGAGGGSKASAKPAGGAKKSTGAKKPTGGKKPAGGKKK